MLTRETAINTAQDYVKEIKAQGIRLHKAFIFGSFAKGTQHEWSDIDVMLVADEFQGLPQDMRLFYQVCLKKPYIRIEAQTYPTDYFNEGDPFITEIIQTGIELAT
jgi:predicted nucleotidyltransferase